MTPQELVQFLKSYGIRSLVTIDFETYYSNGKVIPDKYSLSSNDMTTEQYIRDERFKAHMMGFKLNKDPCKLYAPFGEDRPGADAWWQTWLPKFAWNDYAVICHNSYFDGGILGLRYNTFPRLYIDTLTMARALYGADVPKDLGSLAEMHGLGRKGWQLSESNGVETLDSRVYASLSEYCVGTQAAQAAGLPTTANVQGDVNLAYEVFWKMLPFFTAKHLRVIDFFVRMFTRPLLIGDPNGLGGYYNELRMRQDELLCSIGLGNDVELIKKELRRANEFARILKYFGIEPPTKIRKPTKKELEKDPQAQPKEVFAFAKTDTGMKDLIEHQDEHIQALAAAKLSLSSTLEQTRTARLRDMAHRGNMCMPVKWFGAHTGRGSGFDKINPQNFSRKSPIKNHLHVPPNYSLVGADSGQIQARLTAWVAQQDDLLDDFRKQDKKELEYDDVYCKFSSESVYNKRITKGQEHFVERFIGKQCVLGLGFGMGGSKFIATVRTLAFSMLGITLELPPEEAKRIVNAYRGRYFRVKQNWDELETMLRGLIAKDYTVTAGRPGALTLCNRGIMLPDSTVMKYTNFREQVKRDDKGEVVYDPYTRQPRKEMVFNKSRSQIEYTWGGKVLENVVQALEQCIMNDKAIEIIDETGYPLVLQEHDCLYFMVPDDHAVKFEQYFKSVMSTSKDWYHDLPLATDTGRGKTLMQAKP